MIYLYPSGDTFAVFNDKSSIPEKYHNSLIEIDSLPDGYGILKRKEDESFYYETVEHKVPEPMDPAPEVPKETIEEKLARLEQQLETQNQRNLVLMDMNMTIYEELLLLQERLTNA